MTTVTSWTQPPATSPKLSDKSVTTPSTSSVTETKQADVQATKITISGKALMLSRLFRTSDPGAEPAVETNTSKLAGSVYDFLTQDDRNLVIRLYEYANAKGTDSIHVDNFAFDLAIHRRAGSGGLSGGVGYDLDGNPVINEFKPEDEAIAQRILTSKAINDTEIDHDFLKSLLDPAIRAKPAVDFKFLQQVVFAFSASGSDGSADPSATPVVRLRKEDFPPLKLTIQQTEDGNTTMLARLFGIAGISGKPDDKTPGASSLDSALVRYLSPSDGTLLGQMYALAKQRGEDLSKIDKLAITLSAYRMRESMLSSANTG